MRGHTEESWCQPAQEQVDEHFTAIETAKLELLKAEQGRDEQQRVIDDLTIEGELIERAAPNWLKRLFLTKEARVHRERISKNAEAQIQSRHKLKQFERQISKDLEPSLLRAKTAYREAEKKLEVIQKYWEEKSLAFSELNERFGKISPPENLSDLEIDDIQISGFWHTKELAGLRSICSKRLWRYTRLGFWPLFKKGAVLAVILLSSNVPCKVSLLEPLKTGWLFGKACSCLCQLSRAPSLPSHGNLKMLGPIALDGCSLMKLDKQYHRRLLVRS
ncbi:hypothetical protein ACQU0X_32685 [Pseudovibrio ascidiaceicola]|uniref:hypothetical protein n=1 Tax=Pseudovibrio ascidiaceicola TaxID=285279 RepID=UPI003D369565